MFKYTPKRKLINKLRPPEMGYAPAHYAIVKDVLEDYFFPLTIDDELIRVAQDEFPKTVAFEHTEVANVFIGGYYFPVTMFDIVRA